MTEAEYYQWLRDQDFEPTGDGTKLLEEWYDGRRYIMVSRPQNLTPADRVAAIERYKMYLGIGYPPGGPGVH